MLQQNKQQWYVSQSVKEKNVLKLKDEELKTNKEKDESKVIL